ncbi:MAG: response regulator [Leptospira bouyouniensis]|uniref:Response regulator n=1 Tax=Leptospira bouyouniensis TaxID=2484911 RepID=A0A7I0HN10_9LEPT|nr:response regulator [Leptospira bouyouniensis]TGK48780.1 response regulator [Leptospira bouyouniensis]TGL02355.1 response regulator [Leptospira bouyouniensis]TGM81224.1 response regulator [Leptospira bouyouniensis]
MEILTEKKNGKKGILFVDDESIILLSMKSQVKHHFGERFKYLTAENAKEAWDLILELEEEGSSVAVIISDWAMPGMNGDEFLRKVHKRFPSIEKVIITGFAEEKLVEALTKEIGLITCLKKPWDEEELITAITHAVEP